MLIPNDVRYSATVAAAEMPTASKQKRNVNKHADQMIESIFNLIKWKFNKIEEN